MPKPLFDSACIYLCSKQASWHQRCLQSLQSRRWSCRRLPRLSCPHWHRLSIGRCDPNVHRSLEALRSRDHTSHGTWRFCQWHLPLTCVHPRLAPKYLNYSTLIKGYLAVGVRGHCFLFNSVAAATVCLLDCRPGLTEQKQETTLTSPHSEVFVLDSNTPLQKAPI